MSAAATSGIAPHPGAAAFRSLVLAALVLAGAAVYPDAPDISGTIESASEAAAGAGGAPGFSLGFEEYANLRLKASAGERGTVYAAVNLVALAGAPADLAARAAEAADLAGYALPVTSFVTGENYAAALELERLYIRIRGESLDLEAGLLRIPLGYGLAWRPLDFLAPPNPLVPNARPRGVLGTVVSAYPSETARVKAFLAAGADPLESGGEGTVLGAAADVHGRRASLLGLYAFQTPSSGHSRGIHRAGISAKLEAGAGIVLEALYEYDPDADPGPEGLQAALGLDYSFLDGDLYVLGQYLYNGPGALAPGDDLGDLYDSSGDPWYETDPAERIPAAGMTIAELNRRNYLYSALTYRWSDYTRSTLSWALSPDDLSFSPDLTIEHEPFQGMTVSLSCRAFLDPRSLSGSGNYGELGPVNTGRYASLGLRARLKF